MDLLAMVADTIHMVMAGDIAVIVHMDLLMVVADILVQMPIVLLPLTIHILILLQVMAQRIMIITETEMEVQVQQEILQEEVLVSLIT